MRSRECARTEGGVCEIRHLYWRCYWIGDNIVNLRWSGCYWSASHSLTTLSFDSSEYRLIAPSSWFCSFGRMLFENFLPFFLMAALVGEGRCFVWELIDKYAVFIRPTAMMLLSRAALTNCFLPILRLIFSIFDPQSPPSIPLSFTFLLSQQHRSLIRFHFSLSHDSSRNGCYTHPIYHPSALSLHIYHHLSFRNLTFSIIWGEFYDRWTHFA